MHRDMKVMRQLYCIICSASFFHLAGEKLKFFFSFFELF